MKKNFDNFLFHCSQLPLLMTKSEDHDKLSTTTKSQLEKLWIGAKYGRFVDTKSKYTEKGIEVEDEGIKMLSRKKNSQFVKNTKLYSNKFITGTPDVVSTVIYDIKCPWDLFTYVKSRKDKAEKDYYYQMLGYMWLTGLKEANIVYCLVNTPQIFIRDLLYRKSFEFTEDSKEYNEYKAQVVKNMTYDDIPEEKRIKVFKFRYYEQEIEKLKNQAIEWTAYLNKLSL